MSENLPNDRQFNENIKSLIISNKRAAHPYYAPAKYNYIIIPKPAFQKVLSDDKNLPSTTLEKPHLYYFSKYIFLLQIL